MPQPRQQPEVPRELQPHRSGSRWIVARPEPEDVAQWFNDSVRVHAGLDPENYVGGITLITQKEKLDVQSDGVIREVSRLVHIPYAKVETRVAYWNDYLDLVKDEAVGVVEPVLGKELDEPGLRNDYLPPGFFRHPVALADGKFTNYIGCSMRVVLFDKATVDFRVVTVPGQGKVEKVVGKPLRTFGTGTKAVPLLGRYGADDNAIMKAETGAMGRALGMAGMLIIPGSGVATAEDMLELRDRGEAQEPAPPESAPTDAVAQEASGQTTEEQMRTRIAEGVAKLQSENADGYGELEAWAQEKSIDLDQPKESQLRPLLRQIERRGG